MTIWDIIIYLILTGLLIVPPMLIFMLYWFDRKTSRFLYFNTEDTCQMISSEVVDGNFHFNDGRIEKHFDIDKAKPVHVKTFFSIKPLYFLKWNSVAPLKVNIEQNKIEDIKMTPDSLGQLKKSTVIEKLMNPKGQGFNMFLFLILGVIVGAPVGYIIALSMK